MYCRGWTSGLKNVWTTRTFSRNQRTKKGQRLRLYVGRSLPGNRTLRRLRRDELAEGAVLQPLPIHAEHSSGQNKLCPVPSQNTPSRREVQKQILYSFFNTLKPNLTQGTDSHPQPAPLQLLSGHVPSEELDKALPPLPAKVRNVSPVAAQRTRKKIILLEATEASPIPASSSMF